MNTLLPAVREISIYAAPSATCWPARTARSPTSPAISSASVPRR